MMRNATLLLCASILLSVASITAFPTNALAKKSTKPAVKAAPISVTAPAVVVDTGGPADRVPRCFDSVIRYPYPPCY
jgi:hypothetical protein